MVREREIKKICDRIVASFAPERVILFGSQASDSDGPDCPTPGCREAEDRTARLLSRWDPHAGQSHP